jgi:endonuclease-3 related protein
MDNQPVNQRLLEIYQHLFACYGPQHWWPGESPFEVMVGAILTQSAAWGNVEKALANLKVVGALSAEALRRLSLPELAKLIRPCGYYNAKALKLKSLALWLGKSCGDNLDKLFAKDTATLRQQLLAVHGIGQETADSILLYAAGKPIFVIDAYTRRIISRIGLALERDSYSAYQALFMENLPGDVKLFNEYHALFVCLGKKVCRKQPICGECCLRQLCRSSLKLGKPEIASLRSQ